MSTRTRLADWHWPHAFLLTLLPLVWAVAGWRGWDATATLAGWLLLNLIALGVAERVRPFRHDWQPAASHLRRDGSVLGMNLVADAAVGTALTAAAIAWLPGQSTWPLAIQIGVGVLAAEFASYWLHRLSHSAHWLWGVHLLHHRPGALNVANALTAHPINAVYEKLARLGPLLLLGLSPDALLAVAMFGLTQGLVTHANVAGRIGPLNWILGSAELHRLHHSTREDEAKNFGTSLPIWDLVFGTYRPATTAPVQVGVFEPSRYPDELALAALLVWPFRPLDRLFAMPQWRCCARGA